MDRPADHFTMVSNAFARDARISFAARGLGLWLLSHAEGWQITASGIAKAHGMGRDTVRRLLVELEHHRYLRRVRQRGDSGQLGGMVYQVRCSPFPPDGEENPSSDLRLDPQALVDQSPAGAHHKKTSPKDNTEQKTTPSGGSPTGERGDPSTATEEPVKHPPDALALDLELPAPAALEIRPRQNGKNAATVTAAYVDSYREHHSGGDPLRRDIGRVARDAAELIRTGRATVEELAAAAEAMGAGRYSNLGVQLNIVRERGKRTGIARGPVPVSPREGFAAAAAEQHAKFVDEIRNDPDVARWVADDPAAVERLCAEHPDLRTVFERVAAA